jgi:hypothetical protein
MKKILILALAVCGGCATPTVKPQAGDLWPNTYSVGPYFGPGFKPYWGMSVSGNIPPWLNPFNYWK